MINKEIFSSLTDIYISLIGFIPKLIGAILILFIGMAIGKFIGRFVKGVLKRMNVDVIADHINNIDILSSNNFKIELSDVLSKFIYYLILMVFIMTAIGVLDMPILANLLQEFILFIPNLLAAFFILIGGLLFAEFLKNIVTSTCKSLGMPSASIIGYFVFYFIFVNIIIVALTQAGISTEFFAQNISIIIAGGVLAFSIGYGFASKDIVSSFLASYYTEGKFKVGDLVEINGIKGYIKNIDKSTLVLTTENKDIIIPLNKLLNDHIEIFH